MKVVIYNDGTGYIEKSGKKMAFYAISDFARGELDVRFDKIKKGHPLVINDQRAKKARVDGIALVVL